MEMSGFLEMIEDLAGEFQMSRTEAILAPSFSMWIENRSGMDLSWICSLNFVWRKNTKNNIFFKDFDRRSSGIGSDFEGTQSCLSYSYR